MVETECLQKPEILTEIHGACLTFQRLRLHIKLLSFPLAATYKCFAATCIVAKGTPSRLDHVTV